jgi:integrase
MLFAPERNMTKRTRGTGCLILRGKTETSDGIWWMQYCQDGKVFRESNTVGEMMKRLLEKKANNGAKSIDWDKARWSKHLEPVFGHIKARSVTEDKLQAYMTARRAEAAAPATINRELALLRRAFKIHHTIPCPKFELIKENNVRQGFLSDEQYAKLSTECAKEGLWLRALLEIGANYGLRKGEMLDLHVSQVDKATGRVRLEGSQTKNGTPRAFTLTSAARHLVFALIEGKQPNDYVFTRADGHAVKDFRKVWSNVCERAGVPDLLLHDLRRTAVRNMVRAGISDDIAMDISGHKTRSVFSRYNITSEADLDAAAALLEKRPKIASDTNMTQSAPILVQRPN